MKRNLNYLGAILVFLGAMLKIQHWPFALYTLAGGFIAILVSAFIKSDSETATDSYTDILDSENTTPKPTLTSKYRLVDVSTGLFVIGAFFKLMHYPYATLILSAGFLLVFLTKVIRI